MRIPVDVIHRILLRNSPVGTLNLAYTNLYKVQEELHEWLENKGKE